MHSSTMRTVRNSSRLLSGPGGVSDPGGVPGSGGGGLLQGGVPGPGVGGIPACTEADPPVNRMTDRQV